MYTRPVPIAPWCGDPYCGKAKSSALLLSSLICAPGGVFATAPRPPGSLELILMFPTIGRTSNQWCLLPRRAHALDGAGQQTTARRHRGLLPAGSLRLVLMAQASTPSCLPQQALCSAVRATHPVRSTGKGRRAESRSVSDPEPESLAAEPRPRRDRPVPSAGPGATIRHRVLSGKSSFLLLTGCSHCRTGVPAAGEAGPGAGQQHAPASHLSARQQTSMPSGSGLLPGPVSRALRAWRDHWGWVWLYLTQSLAMFSTTVCSSEHGGLPPFVLPALNTRVPCAC